MHWNIPADESREWLIDLSDVRCIMYEDRDRDETQYIKLYPFFFFLSVHYLTVNNRVELKTADDRKRALRQVQLARNPTIQAPFQRRTLFITRWNLVQFIYNLYTRPAAAELVIYYRFKSDFTDEVRVYLRFYTYTT